MLCMWATGAKLDEAFDLLYYWGMIYVTILFVYTVNHYICNNTKACKNNVHKY